jgi:hypothetical protein
MENGADRPDVKFHRHNARQDEPDWKEELCDGKWRLFLWWRECLPSGNFLEGLQDEDEEIQILSRPGADFIKVVCFQHGLFNES